MEKNQNQFVEGLTKLNKDIVYSMKIMNSILRDLKELKWYNVVDVHTNGAAGLHNLRLALGVRLD